MVEPQSDANGFLPNSGDAGEDDRSANGDNPILSILHLWFGFREDVSQLAYASTGFGLMLLKYAVEAYVLWRVNGAVFRPLDFLNPVLSAREELVRGAPEWLGWAWFAWTLPFLWIAVSMSVRRAANAGLSPGAGLLVLVPFANVLWMLALAALPTRRKTYWTRDDRAAFSVHRIRSAVMGVAVGSLVAVPMVGLGIYVFDIYGASLFLGTSVLMGAVSAVIFNLKRKQSFSASVGVGVFAVICAGCALLIFAFEGVICLAMAAPIVLPLGGLGGAIGKMIAETTVRPVQGTFAVVLLLPVWAGVESFYHPERECVVLTVVNIDAPVERVWANVIEFPDLPEPEEWYFRLGISCPVKARIEGEGEGVGATRHCIFTTGTFVEPITVWEEPVRLAFDVASQPAPMFELSPYRHVHPPHLAGTLSSKRGEFKLVPLPGGKTRLEGRTWYTFDMHPQSYWTLWSDLMIHRIHRRVLEHIKRLSEAEALH